MAYRLSDEERDRRAEEWLCARHDDDWYIGSASLAEWVEAYAAVDAESAREGTPQP